MSAHNAKVKWRQRTKNTPGRGRSGPHKPSLRRSRSVSPEGYHYTPSRSIQPPAKKPKKGDKTFLNLLSIMEMDTLSLVHALLDRGIGPRALQDIALLHWPTTACLKKKDFCGGAAIILRKLRASVSDVSGAGPFYGTRCSTRHSPYPNGVNRFIRNLGVCWTIPISNMDSVSFRSSS